jgi:hypothetical protein
MKTITLKCKNLLPLITLLFFVTAGEAQTTQVYNANDTFVVPAGVTSVQAEAWGAGGAGGGNSTNNDGGGGGGGGAYSRVTLSVTVATAMPLLLVPVELDQSEPETREETLPSAQFLH